MNDENPFHAIEFFKHWRTDEELEDYVISTKRANYESIYPLLNLWNSTNGATVASMLPKKELEIALRASHETFDLLFEFFALFPIESVSYDGKKFFHEEIPYCYFHDALPEMLPAKIIPDPTKTLLFNFKFQLSDEEASRSWITQIKPEYEVKEENVYFSFPPYRRIIFKNECGHRGKYEVGSDDWRGADNCGLVLPFHSEYTLEGPKFNFVDMITAFYLVKSHKWDHNYELFCNTWVTIDDDDIVLDFNFCHGS